MFCPFIRWVNLSCLFLLGSGMADAQLGGAFQFVETLPEDPAKEMVAGIDRFLLVQTDQASKVRDSAYWQGSDDIESNRRFLIEQLGLEAGRHDGDAAFLAAPEALARDGDRVISQVRWPVLSHPAPQTAGIATLWGEGLHIGTSERRALVIVIPDASETPEDFLPTPPLNDRKRLVRSLAASANVLIVATTSRDLHRHGNATLSRREYLHRAAFELGRTLTGYEVQTVQAAIDRFAGDQPSIVLGFGEGGMTALMSGAIDTRIKATLVGNYFEDRSMLWQQPISRQVFGLLNRFSDAHLAALIAPRRFVEFADKHYSVSLPGQGGAPAQWESPNREARIRELSRLNGLTASLYPDYHGAQSLETGLDAIPGIVAEEIGKPIAQPATHPVSWSVDPQSLSALSQQRSQRLFAMIDAHNQLILSESDHLRAEFMNLGYSRTHVDSDTNRLDTSSAESYRTSIKRFRTHFREKTIGWFSDPLLDAKARGMKLRDGNGWTRYGVMLDVYPEVFAYGELLIPQGMSAEEQRPVVVCQHGLEGRPEDTIVGDHRAYHDFAARLAEEGFIVFAPQNPYIGRDAFRTLQRKSYPIGKTLFSVIGAQHQQIIRWLKSLPNVDPDRIAFYGLSYGGKSAMRLPALLPEYCLSICSADFNDWVWKNASSRSRYSYVGTGEYEIFEFGLGKTFNYAEMAALIAPRPFMVERGHHDGVAPDDRVAKEFAKVRYLYASRLKLPDACEIEWFDGPHTINGQGTFAFLRRHLDWPTRQPEASNKKSP